MNAEIDAVEAEPFAPRPRRNRRQPVMLQLHVVVFVDIVDADHGFAALQQSPGHVHADEAGTTCHENRHDRARSNRATGVALHGIGRTL